MVIYVKGYCVYRDDQRGHLLRVHNVEFSVMVQSVASGSRSCEWAVTGLSTYETLNSATLRAPR